MKRSLLSMLFLLLALAPLVGAQDSTETEGLRLRKAPWPKEVLEAAGRIPMQEGGRTKPLSSMAGFMMLSINAKRSFETTWGEKLDPVSWFLDCVFYPEQALHYRILRLQDYSIVESIGLKRHSTKRADNYSMREILPASEQLEQQSSLINKKNAGERTALEGQILNLGINMRRLLFLTSCMDFARAEFELSEMPEFESAFPDVSFISGLEMLTELDNVRQMVTSTGIEPSVGINAALDEVQRQLMAADFLNFIPPADKSKEAYFSPREVMELNLIGGTPLPVEMEIVKRLPELVAVREDVNKLGAGIIALQAELQGMASARGEFAKVAEEVAFYEKDWFMRSQYFFWGGFLFCLLTWFFKRQTQAWKVIYGLGIAMVLVGEYFVVGGIVARCFLKDRPPITTVYEALLFIFAAIVLMSLFIELLKRNTLALSVAALVGGAGMYIGQWNVTTEGSDTIAPLVAVLDTNFWLSIHVPTITLGYAAGLLAALLGHVFLFGKLWDVTRRGLGRSGVNKSFFAEVTKMTYGVLCFGALTATVGTILGGVWANDSWGRFWGWDPKENGALALCLGYIIILHGRMGGYLRQFGIALCSILLGIIVLWAFWGVNLLQVGFHSYGFDATKARITSLYNWVELAVVSLGVMIWVLDRYMPKSRLLK